MGIHVRNVAASSEEVRREIAHEQHRGPIVIVLTILFTEELSAAAQPLLRTYIASALPRDMMQL